MPIPDLSSSSCPHTCIKPAMYSLHSHKVGEALLPCKAPLIPSCLRRRYISIVVTTANGVGYFGTFSPEDCERFFLVAPSFKGCYLIRKIHWAVPELTHILGVNPVLQTITSHLILSVRCGNIRIRKISDV